jgi:hypothetical protein
VNVRLMVSGRGYQASESLPQSLALPEGCSLDEALQTLASLMPADRRLDGRCLIAVSGTHLGTVRSHRPYVLREGEELVVIAPVAGG